MTQASELTHAHTKCSRAILIVSVVVSARAFVFVSREVNRFHLKIDMTLQWQHLFHASVVFFAIAQSSTDLHKRLWSRMRSRTVLCVPLCWSMRDYNRMEFSVCECKMAFYFHDFATKLLEHFNVRVFNGIYFFAVCVAIGVCMCVCVCESVRRARLHIDLIYHCVLPKCTHNHKQI